MILSHDNIIANFGTISLFAGHMNFVRHLTFRVRQVVMGKMKKAAELQLAHTACVKIGLITEITLSISYFSENR